MKIKQHTLKNNGAGNKLELRIEKTKTLICDGNMDKLIELCIEQM